MRCPSICQDLLTHFEKECPTKTRRESGLHLVQFTRNNNLPNSAGTQYFVACHRPTKVNNLFVISLKNNNNNNNNNSSSSSSNSNSNNSNNSNSNSNNNNNKRTRWPSIVIFQSTGLHIAGSKYTHIADASGAFSSQSPTLWTMIKSILVQSFSWYIQWLLAVTVRVQPHVN